MTRANRPYHGTFGAGFDLELLLPRISSVARTIILSMQYLLIICASFLLGIASIRIWDNTRDTQPPKQTVNGKLGDSAAPVPGDGSAAPVQGGDSDRLSSTESPRTNPAAEATYDPQSVATASAAAFANEPRAREFLELVNSTSFDDFTSRAVREKNWTNAKLLALAHSNNACRMAVSLHEQILNKRDKLYPPMQSYLEHVDSVKHFALTYCKGGNSFQTSLQSALSESFNSNELTELEKTFNVEGMDANRFGAFTAYLNWEPSPQSAFLLAQGVMLKVKPFSPTYQFAVGTEINGRISISQLAKVYALAAEMRSCRYSRTCHAGMPYTMLECMMVSNCRLGQSLVDFRREWTEPVVFNSAQRLAQSWAKTWR